MIDVNGIQTPVVAISRHRLMTDGDGNWYDGAYEAGANVTMIKK